MIEVSLALGAWMLSLGGRASSLEEGREVLLRVLESGRGLEKFQELVAAQGGDPLVAEEPDLLPTAPIVNRVRSPRKGYI
ncbi:MAG: pyrimidine-nucleoside phosphorylase, partial [candidate division NC10 bacterium]|nr:pyrimidine-nucleoside phosphorylase [candidate division NC10 bacterium]